MTMHAAKGLEFPVVFITGCEDGLIPYYRSDDSQGNLDEERRLFYVALTRAQEQIYLTHAAKRLRYGKRTSQRPSPFLAVIQAELLQHAKPAKLKQKKKKEDPQLPLFKV
jgi:superfamily I DNA/RNA helicase